MIAHTTTYLLLFVVLCNREQLNYIFFISRRYIYKRRALGFRKARSLNYSMLYIRYLRVSECFNKTVVRGVLCQIFLIDEWYTRLYIRALKNDANQKARVKSNV